ncbi:MAG: CusA/CzcA family heavy metal efflux RND transporter [candidate division FCPU426 bacterium]
MLSKLIAWSIRNRILVTLLTILVIGWGAYALVKTPVDAIPDLSDVQVILYTQYPGQSPRVVEDQITYPLTTAMVSVPGAQAVRGYSFFGYSLVYIIFKDGTDLYWARSRVLEYINYAQQRLPAGVLPILGPDASGVGWVYQYALVSDQRPLHELRSLQDWYLKYELASVPGVAEAASLGGFVKQYQVTVDPSRLQALGLTLGDVEAAIKAGNQDTGGEVVVLGEREYMIRGLGYLKSIGDLEQLPVAWRPNQQGGTLPVYLKDVADIRLGPEMRRGVAELDGQGETVGGIVVMRFGENARDVIRRVKRKLEELKAGLPADVRIVPVYDRSRLITRAIDNLRGKLFEEMLIVALVCLMFLFHARSALVAVFTLPTAILMSFIVMRSQGINANIMSLGGIAIAIGAMVDAAIVMIENAHKHLEREEALPARRRRPHWQVILEASQEVGPALFWSLLVITVSFAPIFALEAQEGRLFRPLAFTKTYAMAAAALLAVTIVPVLMGFFIRGRVPSEASNPVNRWLLQRYHPLVQWVLRHARGVLLAAAGVVALGAVPLLRLGTEFMPPLFEGDLLYMPTTLPGLSIAAARDLLQRTDRLIRSFPEVERVFGKIGRAETATDPAGLDMIETTIQLKPRKAWRRGLTEAKLIAELDRTVKLPGLTNAWTMPIKARTDMLATGIKTPVGIKLSGPDLGELQRLGTQIEAVLRRVPGTGSAFAERAMGGYYLDIAIDRPAAARYGVNVEDLNRVIQMALGGMNVTTTVEGLERYPVNVRYSRELRDSVESIRRVLVATRTGGQVPLAQVADIKLSPGPMVIRTENSRPNAWVFVDVRGVDLGTYIHRAQTAIGKALRLPEGYTLTWSGEFEYLQRLHRRLLLVVPLTLFIIVLILYLNTRSLAKTAIVLLAVPFSLVGALWFVYALGYNLSLAVWVGLIALAGLDAETGVVMLLYLDHAYEAARSRGRMNGLSDLRVAIDQGAVQRVRPKVMTAAVIIAGLLPIFWGAEAGSDLMRRIAAPMMGGVVTSVLMELAVYPAIYYYWRGWRWLRPGRRAEKPLPA